MHGRRYHYCSWTIEVGSWTRRCRRITRSSTDSSPRLSGFATGFWESVWCLSESWDAWGTRTISHNTVPWRDAIQVVGIKYMSTYLRQIDWALKDDRASAVLTGATYPEPTHTTYQWEYVLTSVKIDLPWSRSNDFCRKYHWPGGISPSPTSFINDVMNAVPRKFCLDSVDDIGISKWSLRVLFFSAYWRLYLVN